MKRGWQWVSWVMAAMAALWSGTVMAGEGVLEFRIYTCEPGKLDALNERFRDHTMKLFEKHGMKNVAYWVATEGPTAGNTLYYILHHSSRDAAKVSWDAFRSDPDWKAVAKASEEKHGKILAKAPEVIFMTETDYSPPTEKARQDKTYELRIYTAAEGKLDDLNARFRNHTEKLFNKHGMRSIGYWVPTDEPKSKTHLYYVLEHTSRDSSKESWTGFISDPEWKAVAQKTEANGKLLAVPPEAVFMKAVDYTPAP
ncbi:MAG: NIPSNAP family protein [Planctomycetota bacterium]|nr:MAG: NIPSNAP family protein [Planctomycetota bacterium]